jgi:hypothetical protein
MRWARRPGRCAAHSGSSGVAERTSRKSRIISLSQGTWHAASACAVGTRRSSEACPRWVTSDAGRRRHVHDHALVSGPCSTLQPMRSSDSGPQAVSYLCRHVRQSFRHHGYMRCASNPTTEVGTRSDAVSTTKHQRGSTSQARQLACALDRHSTRSSGAAAAPPSCLALPPPPASRSPCPDDRAAALAVQLDRVSRSPWPAAAAAWSASPAPPRSPPAGPHTGSHPPPERAAASSDGSTGAGARPAAAAWRASEAQKRATAARRAALISRSGMNRPS